MQGTHKNEYRHRRTVHARQLLVQLIKSKTGKTVRPELIKTTKFAVDCPWRFVPKEGSEFPKTPLSSLSSENLMKIRQAIEQDSVDVVWTDPGFVEDENTLVNLEVPLASIRRYIPAHTQQMQQTIDTLQQRLDALTEENERLRRLNEEATQQVLEGKNRTQQVMEERDRIGVEIEQLQNANEAMGKKLEAISGFLNG